jgi:hypothetical protein
MIEKQGIFWRCCSVLLGNFLPTCHRNVPPYFSGMQINSHNRDTEDIGGNTFETTEGSRERNNPEDPLLYYENIFATNKILQVCVIPSG